MKPVDGYVRCSFFKPRVLDFKTLQKSVTGANYTLYSVEVSTAGKIRRSDGKNGAPPEWELELDGTRQVFKLKLKNEWKGATRVQLVGTVVDFGATPPTLDVKDIQAEVTKN